MFLENAGKKGLNPSFISLFSAKHSSLKWRISEMVIPRTKGGTPESSGTQQGQSG
jgi:hypothetical protein